VLRSIVENCLNKCNSNGKDSIAFPAIGTGILGFPHDVAAKIFFEETKKFEKKIQNCKIKEVSFVVYNQDAKSIEAFKSELKKQQEWDNSESAVAVPVPILSKRRMKRMNMKSTSTKSDSPTRSATGPEGRYDSVMCVKIGKDNKMEIAKGEITKETTDVIAHLTNPGLSLNSSVGKALAEAGGANIRTECQAIANFAKLDFEKTVLTTAGKLDAKYVAHMVSSNDPTYNEIENCITNCLVEASERGCESISFPPVDTGSLKYDPSKAAAAILTSVTRFLNSSPGSLRLVRIVLEDDDLLTVFQTSAKKVNGDEGPGMLKKFVNFFWKSDSTTISVKEKPAVTRKKVSLEIYAKDDDTVALVKKRIKNLLEHQNKKKSLEDDNIEKLSGQQEAEIEELCYKNDVKVTIDKDVNRIIVFGHGDDISKTFDQIHKILRGIGEEEKEKEKAALHADWAEVVSQAVQWFYFDPVNGDHEEYDKQTNAMIEKAYSKKEKSVIFFLGNENCEIVFDDMQETNLDTNEVIEVIRKDLKGN
jgi:O-acetyl-ADP-ribose deacetylase (regulator of RNase III)/phosphoribosyl-ATP pyrophosphohydrolase